MHSTGNPEIIGLKASDSLIDLNEYLSEVKTYLPSLNEDDTWIRSGIHIGEKYKPYISSYRLMGSQTPSLGHARIEVHLVKSQIGVSITDAFPHCVDFMADHLLRTDADAAFVALVPSTGDGWRTFLSYPRPQPPRDPGGHPRTHMLWRSRSTSGGPADSAPRQVDYFFSRIRPLRRHCDKGEGEGGRQVAPQLQILRHRSGIRQMIFAMADLVSRIRTGPRQISRQRG